MEQKSDFKGAEVGGVARRRLLRAFSKGNDIMLVRRPRTVHGPAGT